jgi:TetR/AcrR family transcriptional regulator
MYTKFLGLEPDKQEKIINAAMKEFADKGYAQASTNEIVREAGISKGLLFHYFSNKKQLFFFLYDSAIEIATDRFFAGIDPNETDFFTLIRQIVESKLNILTKYPEIFNFLEQAYEESSPEVKPELEKRNAKVISNNLQKIFEKVDLSKFKANIDLQKAISMVSWVSEGMLNEAIKRSRFLKQKVDFARLLADFKTYEELLKECLYK